MLKCFNPVVIHSPGFHLPSSQRWFHLVNSKCKKSFQLEDATIITWNNKKEKGPLEESLDSMSVEYIVLGKDIHDWRNVIKIMLTDEGLKNISTKYVIGLDSCDVLVMDDPNKIVERFKKMDCRMLFNSQSCCYPKLDKNGNQYDFVEFENSLNKGSYDNCYLNAGAWIGETDFCKQFYKKCKDIFENNDFDKEDICWTISDQAYIRKAFMLFSDFASLDYDNKIFQVIEDSI